MKAKLNFRNGPNPLGCRSRQYGVPCGLADQLIGSSEVGELDRPVDNRDGVAADPDVVSVELYVHAAGPAQRAALARDVGVRRRPLPISHWARPAFKLPV